MNAPRRAPATSSAAGRLQPAGGPAGAETPDLPEVLRCLVQEHRHFAALVAQLERKSQALTSSAGADYYLLTDIVNYMHDYPMQVHHPTETEVFDRLVERDPQYRERVATVCHDHDAVGDETMQLLELIDQALRHPGQRSLRALQTACRNFATHQREHMRFESEQLFPAALQALSGTDWDELAIRFPATGDPLFGRTVASRHRLLFEYMLGASERSLAGSIRSGTLAQERLAAVWDSLGHGRDIYLARLREMATELGDETRAAVEQALRPAGFGAFAVLPARFALRLGVTLFRGGGDLAKISAATARTVAEQALSRRDRRD